MWIVLTGGPGAGKSSFARRAVAERAGALVLVPEAATQVYRRLGRRWDELTLDGRREAQREIFRLQREMEAAAPPREGGMHVLLDRGSVDGAAYWPDGPEAYWADRKTSLEAELARYNRVLILETAAAAGVYDADGSNPTRYEDPATAIATGLAVQRLWAGHSHAARIAAHPSAEAKYAAVLARLDAWIGNIRGRSLGVANVPRTTDAKA